MANDIDLVIFDCDGVLIDSELIACAADAELLTEAGFEISTADVVSRFAGVPSEAVYATLEKDAGRTLPEDLGHRVKARIMDKYRTELRAINGVAEMLEALTARRCVASSSAPAKLALGLVETGLYEAFYPHIFSASLVEHGKPSPDIFLYAADQMGVRPERCLVVEDSVAGVTAARAAGMRCLGFTGGEHCAQGHGARLREAGAMDVLTDIRGLLDRVG